MPDVELKRRSLRGMLVHKVRELGRWLDANAEAVVGDIDSTYITGDGFGIRVEGLAPESVTTVTTSIKRFAVQRSAHGD